MYSSIMVSLLFKNGQTRIFEVKTKEPVDQQEAETFVDLFNGKVTDERGYKQEIATFRLEIQPGQFIFLKIDEIAFSEFFFRKDGEEE